MKITFDLKWNADRDGGSVFADPFLIEIGEEKLTQAEFQDRYPERAKQLGLYFGKYAAKYIDVFYDNVVVYGMPSDTIELAGKEFPTEELVGIATWDDPSPESQVVVEVPDVCPSQVG